MEETAGGKKATYKLTTTVMLAMDVKKESVGDSNLSGSLTRTAEKTSVVDADHTHMAAGGAAEGHDVLDARRAEAKRLRLVRFRAPPVEIRPRRNAQHKPQ